MKVGDAVHRKCYHPVEVRAKYYAARTATPQAAAKKAAAVSAKRARHPSDALVKSEAAAAQAAAGLPLALLLLVAPLAPAPAPDRPRGGLVPRLVAKLPAVGVLGGWLDERGAVHAAAEETQELLDARAA